MFDDDGGGGGGGTSRNDVAVTSIEANGVVRGYCVAFFPFCSATFDGAKGTTGRNRETVDLNWILRGERERPFS